jgi:hypothetical protein
MDSEKLIYKGKYTGKTVEWVQDNDPSYLVWAEECNAKIFEKPKPKKNSINFNNLDVNYENKEVIYKIPEEDSPKSAIRPNVNFDNEKAFSELNNLMENKVENSERKVSGKIIYLASPYSSPDNELREHNYRIISQIAANMVSEGKVVLSPISYGHNLLNFKEMPSDWNFWYNFCVTFLLKSDELVVCKMPGWESSRGVLEEIEIAKQNNIKISFIEPNYF